MGPPPQLRGTSTENQSSTCPGTLDCGANPPHWEAEGPWIPPSSEALPHQVPKTGLRSWDREGWDGGGPPFK